MKRILMLLLLFIASFLVLPVAAAQKEVSEKPFTVHTRIATPDQKIFKFSDLVSSGDAHKKDQLANPMRICRLVGESCDYISYCCAAECKKVCTRKVGCRKEYECEPEQPECKPGHSC